MKRFSIILVTSALIFAKASAADPTATGYAMSDCQGSLRPYPAPSTSVGVPDSLTAVFINHIGRHGSRFPASAANTMLMRKALLRADSTGTITSLGRELLQITDLVISMSDGRWGSLDSLGMAEQRGIASRMVLAYPELFGGTGKVHAISSYSPRAMMSMYSFTHQMDRLNNKLEFTNSTGRQNSRLLRPFDVDPDYIDFRKSEVYKTPYNEHIASVCPTSAIRRVLGDDYPFADKDDELQLALAEYHIIAGLSAMGLTYDPLKLFTIEEYNALWSCFNMRHYLRYTATTLSSVPADIAGPLVLDLIATIDNAVDGKSDYSAYLRFGHAETIMPLASLLRLPGCYYLTNYFDTVALHWRDFEVVPMASNLQFILLRNAHGVHYLRVDLNEYPISLIPNDLRIYIPWSEARDYMMHCVPIYMQ